MNESFPSTETAEAPEVPGVGTPVAEQQQVQTIKVQEVTDTGASLVDADKAWDMAHASKEDREKAAYVRQNIIPKLEEAYNILPEEAQVLRDPSEQGISVRKKLAEHREKYRYEATDGSDAEQHELYLQSVEIKRRVDDLLENKSPSVRNALQTIFREMLNNGEQDIFDELVQEEQETLSYNKERREAEVSRYEADAEVLEYWAGILHDLPPSEAYKERYGLGEVTPAILARLAEQITARDQKIEEFHKYGFRNRLEDAAARSVMGEQATNLESQTETLAGSLVTYSDAGKERIADFAFIPGTEEYLAFDKTMKDPEASDEVKKAAYLDAFDRFTKNSELEFKLKNTFLEDIRTGRAAQWQ